MVARLIVSALAALLLAGTGLPVRAISGCPRPKATSHDHGRAAAHVTSCGLELVGRLEVSKAGGLGQIELHEDLAAVLQRDEGIVALVDVKNPARPKVLGRFDDGASQSLDGDLAFSDDGRFLFYARQTVQFSRDGLHVLDVSDPANPAEVFYLPGGGMLRVAAFMIDGVQFVATLDAVDGLTIARFEPTSGSVIPVRVDPLPPLKVGGPASAGLFFDANDPALGVPLLYVTTGVTGLQVFDLSNPAAPALVGVFDDVGLADLDVRATNNARTVYAATEYWFEPSLAPEVVVLDATDLSAITAEGRLSTGLPAEDTWRVQGIALAGSRLYAAHSHAGLVGFARGGLSALAEIPGAPNPDSGIQPAAAPYAMDVEVAGDLILLSDAVTGTLTLLR